MIEIFRLPASAHPRPGISRPVDFEFLVLLQAPAPDYRAIAIAPCSPPVGRDPRADTWLKPGCIRREFESRHVSNPVQSGPDRQSGTESCRSQVGSRAVESRGLCGCGVASEHNNMAE